MINIFTGKKIGFLSVISNIAQLVIIVLLFPFFSIIFGLIFPNVFNMKDFIVQVMSTIPLLECSIDLVYSLDPSQIDISLNNMGLFNNISGAFLEAIILALILKIVVGFHDYMKTLEKVRGAPILAIFVATFIGTIVLSILGKMTGGIYSLLAYVLLIAILLIGISLLFKSVFKPKGFRLFNEIIKIILGAVCAALISGYASVLLLLLSDSFISVGYGIGCLIVYTVASILSVLALYFSEKLFK